MKLWWSFLKGRVHPKSDIHTFFLLLVLFIILMFWYEFSVLEVSAVESSVVLSNIMKLDASSLMALEDKLHYRWEERHFFFFFFNFGVISLNEWKFLQMPIHLIQKYNMLWYYNNVILSSPCIKTPSPVIILTLLAFLQTAWATVWGFCSLQTCFSVPWSRRCNLASLEREREQARHRSRS